MDGSGFATSYSALAELLKEPTEVPVARDAVSHPGSSAGPASIGPKDLLPVTVAAPKARKDPKEIWDEDEVLDAIEDDVDDAREAPSYEFLYKQAVETTDTFLGMSGKDPSSTCCEDLVVRIELPGVDKVAELDLDVQPSSLRLNSARYKLSMYLPHKVEHEKGKAQWDAAKHVLNVTLRIIREDF